mmetsp:Transcript_13953/g.38355  ORF Transcript_13953/g.38355 Transcript_13953/m.38355 type:complete len:206 (+) Transcript_13953:201-818(+)
MILIRCVNHAPSEMPPSSSCFAQHLRSLLSVVRCCLIVLIGYCLITVRLQVAADVPVILVSRQENVGRCRWRISLLLQSGTLGLGLFVAYLPAFGLWKWNLDAPRAPMTVSKIPNCPAVRVPIMTQRGTRPTVQSLTNPISLAMLARRVIIGPSPPAPALLTLERRVSAGWEMMAEATPAITPERRETPTAVDPETSDGVLPMEA